VTPSPLSFATTPFKFWRGKIIYRFEIVISNFHRGKIMFSYEPNISQYSLITANLNTNKQYNQIIDIQETQSVEFEIDWNYVRPYCKAMTDDGMLTSVGDQFAVQTEFFDCCNGIFFVTPFTELQSPDGSDVEINVYVRAEDIIVNRLSDELVPLGPLVSEADYSNAIKPVTKFKVASEIHSNQEINSLYFGEFPVSFRALLKRFVSTGNLSVTGVVDYNIRQTAFKILPTENITATNSYQNGVNLYIYLKYAFLGVRGGVRKRIVDFAYPDVGNTFNDTVFLMRDSTSTVAISQLANSLPLCSIDGSVLFNTDTNSGIEFEVPFYSNNLFLWACNDDPWFDAGPFFEQSGLRNYIFSSITASPKDSQRVLEYTATGEDFTLFRWLYTYPYSIGLVGG
jgi:hypothetical protein